MYDAAFTSLGQECILRLRKPMVKSNKISSTHLLPPLFFWLLHSDPKKGGEQVRRANFDSIRLPMVRLAFADMLLMWLVQLKSELNVTPRYSLSLVTSSMWLCRV